MTKHCSVCATENKDDAQFCRACGTALAAVPSTPAEDAAAHGAGIVCDECGFQNQPGLRYCANCGVSLLGTVIVPRAKNATPSADDPFAGLSASPPPLSYPSFEPVAPYPPAAAPSPLDSGDWGIPLGTPSHDPGHDHGHAYPPSYDPSLPPPDVPDADLAAAPREQEAFEAPAPYVASASVPAAKPNRAPIIIGVVVALLLVAGGAAWWFMSGSAGSSPSAATSPQPAPLPAPTPLPTPVTPAEPASAAVALPVTPGASVPLATVAPGEVVVPPGPAASTSTSDASPAAGIDPDADAKRVAAEKLRREKAVRDKAEREAKLKAAAERDQAAAAARAEQEAQTRRRAEEAMRARNPVSPQLTTPVPNPAQARGVRELCAGRGTIAESICQSRECGDPSHANEAICRQIREADERRRNYTN